MKRIFLRWSRAAVAFLVLATFAHGQSANLGRIDFPTSGSPEAQKHFIEGVLFLHNFEFEDSVEAFRRAQEAEPGFAMAYWGEAMAHNHPLWREVNVEAGRDALNRLAASPAARLAKAPAERERMYLAAVEHLYGTGGKTARDAAYSKSLWRIHEKYPDDIEAASFYSLSLLGLTNGTRDFRNYMKAGAIAQSVFAKNPLHPGAAHYMIHSFDDPIHAPLGLPAARAYSKIAPSASHAQHMVSHIFVAMGMWDEVATANETAWKVLLAQVKLKHRTVDRLDFHYFAWMHYSYLQQGRYKEAGRLLAIIDKAYREKPTPRLQRYRTQLRGMQMLETRARKTALPAVDDSTPELFVDGVQALNAGNLERASKLLARMDPRRDPHRILKHELGALILLKKGQTEEALERLRKAAAEEEKLPLAYGPPNPMKPSHELLGEVLLDLERPAEAREAFEKGLERAPRRARLLLGLARAAQRSGDRETAQETYRILGKIWRQADADLPELAEVTKGITETARRK